MGKYLHVYDYLNSLGRILEDHEELRKEVLRKFGGPVEFYWV